MGWDWRNCPDYHGEAPPRPPGLPCRCSWAAQAAKLISHGHERFRACADELDGNAESSEARSLRGAEGIVGELSESSRVLTFVIGWLDLDHLHDS